MPHFNPLELIIVLLIVLVLFGGGRVAKLGGELGSAMREFKRGLSGPDEEAKKTADVTTPADPTKKDTVSS